METGCRPTGVTYRIAAVDEELGIVWMRLDFGAGSTFGGGASSLIVWEAFKVYDGRCTRSRRSCK